MKCKSITADRLKQGDEIRIVSPSQNLSVVKKDVFERALAFLSAKGYKVSFSSSYQNDLPLDVSAKVQELHEAFSDSNVKVILTALGGFDCNQILEYLDYNLIKNNPKIICGFSDVTALLNTVYAKTGLVTYHGPHFSSFGYEKERDYTYCFFEKCVSSSEGYRLSASAGVNYSVIQEGEAEGTVIGGNLCTLNLLQGTEFMPSLENVILFLEDDNIMGDYFVPEFERNLQSLLQVKGAKIVGVVFGRFDESCKLTREKIMRIVQNKRQLAGIPIIFNADFGHVFPFFTFPIGGTVKIAAGAESVNIFIKQH